MSDPGLLQALNSPASYARLLADVKSRIRSAQTRAAFAANRELILLYWDIGRMIGQRQAQEGWGAAVIPRLARDLKNELSGVKGFSERNIGYMVRFAREYGLLPVLQQPVAKPASEAAAPPSASKPATLQQLVAEIPWGHNVLLMEKVKDRDVRLWYLRQTLAQGWSRAVLVTMFKQGAHERQGRALTNFKARLPAAQSDLAEEALKDPYIFDFLTLEEPFREREMETGLIGHLEKFLLELGQGFAFVGRQVHLEVGGEDFYVDLLFYHLRLRCFVVIDLKKGAFKPEYAGKMNFYLNVVDDQLRHAQDNPSIGLILCQDKNRIVAEYALRDVRKPIGVSEYQLTRALPKAFKSALPTIREIETELRSVRGR